MKLTPITLRSRHLGGALASALGLLLAQPAAAVPSGAEIGMTVLVLTSQFDDPALIGDAPQLEAAKAMLERIGTPYEVHQYDAAAPSLPILESGNAARYQAIVLPISDVRLLNDNGFYPLAASLARYQYKYGVRMATLYGWPDDSGCLTNRGYQDTSSSPLQTTLTTTGKSAFPYLKAGSSSNSPLPIAGAWTYFAEASPARPSGTTVTPLLQAKAQNGSTYALMSTCSFPNKTPQTGDNSQRELLVLSMDHNPYLTHTTVLSYGMLNWLTKGIMLGHRRVYIDAQIDDIGLPNDIFPYTNADGWHDISTTPWTPLAACPLGGVNAKTGITGCEYRLTGSDISDLVSWQNRVRILTDNASDFRLSFAYNGAGLALRYGGEAQFPPNNPATRLIDENRLYDTLSTYLGIYRNSFKWINHTYDHEDLDGMPYDKVLSEMNLNHNVAEELRVAYYDRVSMVTPRITGLYDAEALSALRAYGIRYLVSDTSRPTPPFGSNCTPDNWPLPSHNSGKENCVEPNIYEVPRYATALYYNVSTPAQWVAEYNHFYGPQGILGNPWGKNLTYAEILDKVSEQLVSYLLTYDARPLMFHAANLRPYNGKNSLLGDLIDTTLSKYNTYYQKLPIASPSLTEIGEIMRRRQTYDESSVRGVIKPGVGVVLSASRDDGQPVVVPLTGLSYGKSVSSYGGQATSFVTLTAAGGYKFSIPQKPSW